MHTEGLHHALRRLHSCSVPQGGNSCSINHSTLYLQAREYLKEFKHAGAAPYLPMKAWGLGGESPSLDIVRDMQEVRGDRPALSNNGISRNCSLLISLLTPPTMLRRCSPIFWVP